MVLRANKSSRRNVRVRAKTDESFPEFSDLVRAKLAELRYVLQQMWREMERLRRMVGGHEASEDWRRLGAEVCDQRVMYLRCMVCLRVWTIRGEAAQHALAEFKKDHSPLTEYGDMIDVWGCEGPGCRVAEDLEAGRYGSSGGDGSRPAVDHDG